MIHAHSLGRAARYYGGRTALASGAARPTFQELHDRVAGIAAALRGHGFQTGDRLALLLPNEYDYLELVYACAWLGVTAVPVNVRLSEPEINHVIADASPRGLIRHSSLPANSETFMAARARPRTPRSPKRLSSQGDLRPGSDFGSGLHQRHNRPSQRRRRDSRQHPGKCQSPQLLDDLSRRQRASSCRADFSHHGLSVHVRRARVRLLPSDDPEVQSAKFLRNGRTRRRQPIGVGADDDQHADRVRQT